MRQCGARLLSFDIWFAGVPGNRYFIGWLRSKVICVGCIADVGIIGQHSLRYTFTTRLIDGVKDINENIKSLPQKQVADLLDHTTSEITELYYVKRDLKMLNVVTDGFEL